MKKKTLSVGEEMNRKNIGSSIARAAAAVLIGLIACLASPSYAAQKDAPSTQKAPASSQKKDAKTPFQHDKTGFVLRDIHATLQCEQCHVEGIFKNTPKYCSGCHGIGTRVGAKPKPVNHVPTTAECDTCHVSAANFYVKSYNHIGITGNCITCHNNQSLGVVSKPMTHFPTLQPCELCHTNTTTFMSWRMDHSGITSGCFMCHGGPQAGSRTFPNIVSYPAAGHITISPASDCNACHTNFFTFLGARFDHTGITPGTCGTCHQGQYPGTVSINPATHIPQNQGNACDTCHTALNTAGYTSFLGATFHGSSVGSATPIPTYPSTCGACHNGAYVSQGAQTKPSFHVTYTAGLDCANAGCHTSATTVGFTTFSGVITPHQPAFYATFPTAAPASPTCSSCHNGTTATGKPAVHVTTTADCITCHTPAATGCANAGNCTTWLGATYIHVGAGLPYTGTFPAGAPAAPTCSSCHLSGVGGARMKPVGHIVTSMDCIVCHTPANTGCGTTGACVNFLGASAAVPHTTAFLGAQTCVTCHNGVQATGMAANPNHIPIGAASCDQCHPAYDGATSLTFGTGASVSVAGIGGVSLKYGMNHAVITGRCDRCHNGSYVNQGIFGAVAKVSNHIPTAIISAAANNDCTTCHTTLTPATIKVVSGTADWLPEIMNHNNAQGGAPYYCVTCHLSSATYLSAKIQKKSHNGASITKDCSSSSCHKPLGRTGTPYSRWN